MSALRIIVVLMCLLFVVMVCKQVASKKMLLKYSLLWLALALLVIVIAVFPEPIFLLSKVMGFNLTSNFVFFVALFFLLAICLSLSVVVSKQAIKLKSAIQSLAILEKEIDTIKRHGSENQ